MKLSYGQRKTTYSLTWTKPDGESVTLDFTTRGDLFNMVRALRKSGFADKSLSAVVVRSVQLAFEGA